MQEIIAKLVSVVGYIDGLVQRVDVISFSDSVWSQYVGQLRYLLGDSLYLVITSVISISALIFVVSFGLKFVALVKQIVPW